MTTCWRVLAAALLAAAPARAGVLSYPDPVLHHVYPAGGRAGTTVAVEFGGNGAFAAAVTGVLVDGPPGITVKDVKVVDAGLVTANLVIAPDAVPGVRRVRVAGGAVGLTNSRPFLVGRLPEVVEAGPNDTAAAAPDVPVPAVVNGRIEAPLDVDYYRFAARKGQRVVAALVGHGLDARVRSKYLSGYLDAGLEVADEHGRVVASAEDSLGLDPVAEFVAPADGRYTVRVQALNYAGSREGVYRLTLGEVPYPTAVFPAGGRRGHPTTVHFSGPNVPATATGTATPAADNPFPWQSARWDHPLDDGRELPFVWGDHPEAVEAEPNDDPGRASPLALPVTVNGRFDRPGDADCYRVRLEQGQKVLFEVTAQRHLRSPADTLLEVLDAAGAVVAENDDGELFAGQCEHDFPSADSRLEFTAPKDGEYAVRLTEQNGLGGPLAVYRLTAEPLVPDFRLHQWPDAVPVWGPGATASFVVQVQRWGGLEGDIRLRVEGLPPGWVGSENVLCGVNYAAPRAGLNQKALLTITAPPGAAVGTAVPFRVVGRVAGKDGTVIERVAQPQTLYGTSHTDRMLLRYGSVSRAAVAPPFDCRLEPLAREVRVPAGAKTAKLAFLVHRTAAGPVDPKEEIGVVLDGETVGVACSWKTPVTLTPGQTKVELEFSVEGRRPATYGVVASRSWSSDLRVGRPGPCTPLVLVTVEPAVTAP